MMTRAVERLTQSSIRGHLKRQLSGPGIGVEIVATDDTIRIITRGELLGYWPISSVLFKHAHAGVFNLDVEGEPWIFSTDDPSRLMSAIPARAMSFDTAGRTRALRPPRTRDRQWLERAAAAGRSGRSKLQVAARLTALLLTIVLVFSVGYLVGRSPGRNLLLIFSILILVTAISVSIWGAIDRSRLKGSSRRNSSGTRSSGTDHVSTAQYFGSEQTAKRLAEALQKVATEAPPVDSYAGNRLRGNDANEAVPLGSSTDETSSIIGDERLNPNDAERTNSASIVLDSRGQVSRRDERTDRAAVGAPDASSTSPGASSDNLEVIRGIGPASAQALGELGYNTFDAIASLSDEDIERIEAVLGPIRNRMDRYQWRDHARRLTDTVDAPHDEDRSPDI